jgi:release factor glutamine methyltransferase
VTTVGEVLAGATARLRTGSPDVVESARLDAELLLAFVLGIERTRLLAYPEAPIGTGQEERRAGLVECRARGEPVAYLRGIAEFHGLAFAVDQRVLVPRPATETLVDLALDEVTRRLVAAPRSPGAAPLAIADVGTGSGAIAVALAVALRRRRMAAEVAIFATDASADAIELARENVAAHVAADTVGLAVADLLPQPGAPVGQLVAPERFDLVCANLPYIRSADLPGLPAPVQFEPAGALDGGADAADLPGLPAPVQFEPAGALDGGADGMAVIRRLLPLLPGRTSPGALALLEIGADQASAVLAAATTALPDWAAEVLPDLAGLPRVACLRRPA